MKKALILMICFVILLFSFELKPERQRREEKLKYEFQKIVKELANVKNGTYKLENRYIIGNDFKKKIDIVGTGNFNKISSTKIYGDLLMNDLCYSVDYFGKKLFKDKDKCLIVDGADIAANKIINNNENYKQELIEDMYNDYHDFSSKYYYVGANPNNYIIFSDQCFRIVNISNNNDLKIIYEGPKNTTENNCRNITSNISGSVGLTTWDRDRNLSGDWISQSSLRELLKEWENNEIIDTNMVKFSIDMSKVDEAEWNVGSVIEENKTLKEDINNEREQKYNSKIGLLNVSDYLKVSCNVSAGYSSEKCKKNNYLYKEKYNWWTINNEDDNVKTAWIVMPSGKIENKKISFSKEFYFSGTRPILYLKSNTKIIGQGSEINPYIVLD